MSKSPPRFVTIARAYGPSEAAIAMGLLRSAGIEVASDGWHTNLVAWQWAHAMGGTHLRVKPEDVEAALELLDSYGPVAPDRSALWRFIVALLVLFWAGIPPPPTGFYRAEPPGAVTRSART